MIQRDRDQQRGAGERQRQHRVRSTASTIAITISTPNATVNTVFSVTCEGRTSLSSPAKRRQYCDSSASGNTSRRRVGPHADDAASSRAIFAASWLPRPRSAVASAVSTAARSSAPSTRAQQVHARLVVAVQLDVGAADQEVRQRQIGIVAQDPLQQADRLVDLAVALGDLGEARDRQRERRVLQRRLLEQPAGVVGAPGRLGEHAQALLRRAEAGRDGARALEGGRRVGDVADLEQAHAAQVRRLARQSG